jgi:hypothetical protein
MNKTYSIEGGRVVDKGHNQTWFAREVGIRQDVLHDGLCKLRVVSKLPTERWCETKDTKKNQASIVKRWHGRDLGLFDQSTHESHVLALALDLIAH